MGLADCINIAGLAKILEKPFKHKLGPLSDTLQAGACVFPTFQNVYTHTIPQFLPTGALAIPFQVNSLTIPTKDRTPLTGPFLGVPNL